MQNLTLSAAFSITCAARWQSPPKASVFTCTTGAHAAGLVEGHRLPGVHPGGEEALDLLDAALVGAGGLQGQALQHF